MLASAEPEADPADDAPQAKRQPRTYAKKRDVDASEERNGQSRAEPATATPTDSDGSPAGKQARPRTRTDAALHDMSHEELMAKLGGSGSPGARSPPRGMVGDARPMDTDDALDGLGEPSMDPDQDQDAARLLFPEEDGLASAPGPAPISKPASPRAASPQRALASPAKSLPSQTTAETETKTKLVPPSPSSDASSPRIGRRKKKSLRHQAESDKSSDDRSAAEASADSESRARTSPRRKRKLHKRTRISSSSSSSSRSLPSDSETRNKDNVASHPLSGDAADFLATQPVDPDADLRLHFSDDEEINEELRRDAERAKKLREELPLDFDKADQQVDASQEDGNDAVDVKGGSKQEKGSDEESTVRRRLKTNRKEVDEIHKESDRLRRTGIVNLEMTVAKQLSMRDFLSRFNNKVAPNQSGAPAQESKPTAAGPAVLDDEPMGKKVETTAVNAVPPKPALAKQAVIELDDDDDDLIAPRAPSSSLRGAKTTKPVEVKSAQQARNAELARRVNQKAEEKKENYNQVRSKALAARRKQEKEDDRLGVKPNVAETGDSPAATVTEPGKASATAATASSAAPIGEPSEAEELREDGMDSGDEDVVMGGIPESERPRKRKLKRARRDDDDGGQVEGVMETSQGQPAQPERSPRVRERSPPLSGRPSPIKNAGIVTDRRGAAREEESEERFLGRFPASMSMRHLTSSFRPPPESNSQFMDYATEPSSFPPNPNMDSDEEDAGLGSPSSEAGRADHLERNDSGDSMEIDPRHKIGFSQFFTDTQMSLDPAGAEASIDPNHKIGFSQLFAETQLPKTGPMEAETNISQAPAGVDPRHQIGFSQLFAGSQVDASDAPLSRSSSNLPQLSVRTTFVPPPNDESQTSAGPFNVQLAYFADDSVPSPAEGDPAPVPPADQQMQPDVAVSADILHTRPAILSKDAAKVLKQKQVLKEKAKSEALKAVGKKGADIRSLFAKQAETTTTTKVPTAPSSDEDPSDIEGAPKRRKEKDLDSEEPSSDSNPGDETGDVGNQGAMDSEQDSEEEDEGEDDSQDESSAQESEATSENESEAEATPEVEPSSGLGSEAVANSEDPSMDDDEGPIVKPKSKKGKSMFVLQEAEEEEDEFQGLGGPDGENSDEDDGKDLEDLIATGKDAIETKPEDFEAILRQHRADDAVKDQEELERLLKDVTSGNLRKRRTDLSGRFLDDEEEDEDLELLLDMRRAADLARRYGGGKRKRGEEMSALEKLASKPETAAFGRTFLKDIGDKSGFLEEEERKSDPVSMLSTPRRRSDSEQHEEEDDDYDKDMEDGEDEEQDGQSEGDRDDSEDSDASEQRNRRPRINRKRYAIVDDEETESGTKVANPASPLASDSNRERKRKHRIVDDDDDDMEPESRQGMPKLATGSVAKPSTTPKRPPLGITLASDDDDDDDQGTFVIQDRSRRTPKKASDRLHPGSAQKRRAPGAMGSLLNRSPNALLKFAKADTNDRVGGPKARTFTHKSSNSQPPAQNMDFTGQSSQQNIEPQRNAKETKATTGSSLLRALSKGK